MTVTRVAALSGIGWRRRHGRSGGSSIVLYPRSSKIGLEYLIKIITVQEKTKTPTIFAEVIRPNSNSRWVKRAPIINIIVTSREESCCVIFRLKCHAISNSHLRTETSAICIIRPTSIGCTISSSVHCTICIQAITIRRRFVVPGKTQHFAEVIVKVSECRVCVSFELEFHSTIVILKKECRLDVQRTEINILENLD
jgi:hypothetical protein